MGASLFKVIMQANNKMVLGPPLTCNHVTKMWWSLFANVVIKHILSKYFKLVEISIVMVLGSMEDECCFSTLFLTKFKLKNRLTNPFDLVVRMFAQDHYSMETFQFGDVIMDRQDRKQMYVVDV